MFEREPDGFPSFTRRIKVLFMLPDDNVLGHSERYPFAFRILFDLHRLDVRKLRNVNWFSRLHIRWECSKEATKLKPCKHCLKLHWVNVINVSNFPVQLDGSIAPYL